MTLEQARAWAHDRMVETMKADFAAGYWWVSQRESLPCVLAGDHIASALCWRCSDTVGWWAEARGRAEIWLSGI